MSKSTQLNQFLGMPFDEKDDTIGLTSSYTLRKVIGVLGMSLPILLYIFLLLSNSYNQPLDSISHYYFTRASGIFISILSILAIFLIIYKGKEPLDFILSTLAGVAAFFVVLFPTSNITDICCDTSKPYSITRIVNNDFREGFHYVSAAIFLCSLALISIFIFTKSNQPKQLRGKKKILRNRIFRTCGIIMLIAMLVMLIGGYYEKIPIEVYKKLHLTFWMETIAIEAFGFAWLIKGKTLFKDETSN